MTQPLFCSTSAPWGNHISLQDNICPRCGWAAPGAESSDRISDGGSDPLADTGAAILPS